MLGASARQPLRCSFAGKRVLGIREIRYASDDQRIPYPLGKDDLRLVSVELSSVGAVSLGMTASILPIHQQRRSTKTCGTWVRRKTASYRRSSARTTSSSPSQRRNLRWTGDFTAMTSNPSNHRQTLKARYALGSGIYRFVLLPSTVEIHGRLIAFLNKISSTRAIMLVKLSLSGNIYNSAPKPHTVEASLVQWIVARPTGLMSRFVPSALSQSSSIILSRSISTSSILFEKGRSVCTSARTLSASHITSAGSLFDATIFIPNRHDKLLCSFEMPRHCIVNFLMRSKISTRLSLGYLI